MARKTVLRKRKTAINSVRTNKVDDKFNKFNSDQLINFLVCKLSPKQGGLSMSEINELIKVSGIKSSKDNNYLKTKRDKCVELTVHNTKNFIKSIKKTKTFQFLELVGSKKNILEEFPLNTNLNTKNLDSGEIIELNNRFKRAIEERKEEIKKITKFRNNLARKIEKLVKEQKKGKEFDRKISTLEEIDPDTKKKTEKYHKNKKIISGNIDKLKENDVELKNLQNLLKSKTNEIDKLKQQLDKFKSSHKNTEKEINYSFDDEKMQKIYNLIKDNKTKKLVQELQYLRINNEKNDRYNL